MQTYLDCVPCFMRQALDASRMVMDDPMLQERVIRQTLALAAEMPFDHSPPYMGQQIHRLLRETSGNPDPYSEVKKRSNAFALNLLPELRQRISASDNPFATAVLLAIAGNIIDFGCRSTLDDHEIHQAIEHALEPHVMQENKPAIDEFQHAITQARDILYLADNAGEIVFDRLLLEQMPTDRTTLVVRGTPVINDATREDAHVAGLDKIINIMDNGTDVPGTILESCSDAFQARFEKADMIIAKGQGNYETLNNANANIYFLLKAKCPVIARDIGCNIGQAIVCHHCPADNNG